MTRAIVFAACVAMGLCPALDARAVWLNPDGYGQALIYSYYTTRAAAGNSFNTYITIVNHDSRAKAVRFRFREGRTGKQVASFNLFLSPRDAWAGAVVPTQFGAKVLTTDRSCTSPSLYPVGPGPSPPPGQVAELEFSDAAYSGANADGAGEGPDRAREGYVEVIEMATLTGASADAVTHGGTSGEPPDCLAAQSPTFSPTVGPPTGGLSGSGTLINVQSGMDFSYNAEALDGLANAPFYRPPTDPYPDFDAAEVAPVSDLTWEGRHYHFTWTRPVDAVSSVFVRWEVFNEIIRDPNTQSATDWVFTFPTRRFYVSGGNATPPFSPNCEDLSVTSASREELRVRTQPRVCFAASVMWMRDDSSVSLTPVLGSFNGAEGQAPIGSSQIVSGWAVVGFVGPGPGVGLKSQPSTTVRDMRTEQLAVSGERVLRGLPVMGLMVRSFLNGTLSCASVACQGNYGGSFVHRYRRFINTPSP